LKRIENKKNKNCQNDLVIGLLGNISNLKGYYVIEQLVLFAKKQNQWCKDKGRNKHIRIVLFGNNSSSTQLAAYRGPTSVNNTGGLFINPIRSITNSIGPIITIANSPLYPLLWNTTTSEISYSVAATSLVSALSYAPITGILTAGGFNAVSDKNLKTNVQNLDLEYSKNLVSKINPVSYTFKNDPIRKRFGFIAQEIEKVIHGETLGLHYSDPENKLPQSIGYQELIAPLVKIINDLLIRVEILEKKNNI
jgi:hypothetical protein